MSNVVFVKKDDIEYMQFKKLLEFQDELTHAYTLKTYGIGLNKDIENTNKVFEILANTFNFSKEDIIKTKQTHTNNIVEINDKEVSLENTDGIITDKKEKAILTSTSDCICFMLYDPQNKVIANIHSGWKGTSKRIIQNAISLMIKDYDCKVNNIICCIGPSLRKDHFLVNQDVVDIFQNEFYNYIKKSPIIEETDLTNQKGKQYKIDTILINKLMLKEMGVLKQNIIDSEICTMCENDKFFSYRIFGQNYKNNIGLMMLKKKAIHNDKELSKNL